MNQGIGRPGDSPTRVATMPGPPRTLLRPMAPLFSSPISADSSPGTSPAIFPAMVPKYAARPTLGVPHLAASPLQVQSRPPFQAPMMSTPGLMPGLGASVRPVAPTIMAQNGKQQLVVTLEVKDDFEPTLELKYENNQPVMHLSAEDSYVVISAVDADTGQRIYHEPLQLPLRFPNLHYAKVNYTDGARLEVSDMALLKAPITRYSGKDPTIRIRTIGTSGRVGFIDRGTSPKAGGKGLNPKVGEGFFEYTVTMNEDVIAEVAAPDESLDDADAATEMFVTATIQLQGVITASLTS